MRPAPASVVRTLEIYPDLSLTLTDAGRGRPVLVLHGGAGPGPVRGLAEHLAREARVLLPVHPGWNGARRPEWMTEIDDYALMYLHLLQDCGLRDVVVVGTSLGGWIASELAVRDNGGILGALVLIDAVGVEVDGEAVVDVESLDARALAEATWHRPRRGLVDPAGLSAEQLELRRQNLGTARLLKGDRGLHSPKLRRRLGRVHVPTLVIWGESDRLVTPAYGAAYAAAFPDARFEVVRGAGHQPTLEQPKATFSLVDEHLRRTGRPSDPLTR